MPNDIVVGRGHSSGAWSGLAIHGIAEPLYLFIFTQFRTENRCALFLELL